MQPSKNKKNPFLLNNNEPSASSSFFDEKSPNHPGTTKPNSRIGVVVAMGVTLVMLGAGFAFFMVSNAPQNDEKRLMPQQISVTTPNTSEFDQAMDSLENVLKKLQDDLKKAGE